MKINKKLVENAAFWYELYVRNTNAAICIGRCTLDPSLAETHRKMAREYLDMYFRVAEAAMAETVGGKAETN